MIDTGYSLALVAVMTMGTMFLRFLPFIMFSKGTPKVILYLGEVLPYAIIAMLVVYCLKSVDFTESPHGLPEAVSVALVIAIHKWKRSTILSILAGTICYMLLLRIAV